ncbi:hypothetical protein CLF_112705 [Clonorchis sinensis]|uniref:Uncharacterized protein n=1 Tax=Clonorchis sinensis TaxID=79923 RepID=G7YWU7_CLOSI|nr:hypothetical protein CLF_112705 [Clonorchis sinensis]
MERRCVEQNCFKLDCSCLDMLMLSADIPASAKGPLKYSDSNNHANDNLDVVDLWCYRNRNPLRGTAICLRLDYKSSAFWNLSNSDQNAPACYRYPKKTSNHRNRILLRAFNLRTIRDLGYGTVLSHPRNFGTFYGLKSRTLRDVKIQMRPMCVGGVVVTRSPSISDVRDSNPGTAIGYALLMSSNKSETRVQCFPLVWTHPEQENDRSKESGVDMNNKDLFCKLSQSMPKSPETMYGYFILIDSHQQHASHKTPRRFAPATLRLEFETTSDSAAVTNSQLNRIPYR